MEYGFDLLIRIQHVSDVQILLEENRRAYPYFLRYEKHSDLPNWLLFWFGEKQ